jgi:hypothetical protein
MFCLHKWQEEMDSHLQINTFPTNHSSYASQFSAQGSGTPDHEEDFFFIND